MLLTACQNKASGDWYPPKFSFHDDTKYWIKQCEIKHPPQSIQVNYDFDRLAKREITIEKNRPQ